MDSAIDGKEGYEKTDHGPFLNMVSLLFPLGKFFIRKEETPDSPKQELPQKCNARHRPKGGSYSTTTNSRHFIAVSLLKIHQILMLAFAGLIVEEEVAQMLVVSQPPPWAFLVFLLSDWWEACATSAAVGGGAPVPRSAGTGNREGAPSPKPSCARSDQAGALERQKKHQEEIFISK